MRGGFDEARSLYRRSRATLDELGWRFDAALTSAVASGAVELIAGDAVAAEAELRRDHEALAAMGERNYISTTAAFLAEALYRQGRDEEAFRMTEESEQIAAADDVATQYLWRSVRAKLLARRGELRRSGGDGARGDRRSSRRPRTPTRRGMPGSTSRRCSGWPGERAEAMRRGRRGGQRCSTKGNESSAARARALRRAIEGSGDGG